MRSFLHILLTGYLLAVSAGVPFYRHFCMGELRDSAVAITHVEAKSCCGSTEKKSDCCDHTVSLEKTQEQQTFSFDFQMAPALLAQPLHHTTYAPLAITGLQEGYPADTSPPRPGIPLSVLYQNFRC